MACWLHSNPQSGGLLHCNRALLTNGLSLVSTTSSMLLLPSFSVASQPRPFLCMVPLCQTSLLVLLNFTKSLSALTSDFWGLCEGQCRPSAYSLLPSNSLAHSCTMGTLCTTVLVNTKGVTQHQTETDPWEQQHNRPMDKCKEFIIQKATEVQYLVLTLQVVTVHWVAGVHFF